MLSKKLKPSKLYDLIRVGKENDGGYLICKKSSLESNLLFSFGISDDFSFEKQFKDINNCKIIAYDPSSTNNFFIKKILIALLKLDLTLFVKNIINFINFLMFFGQKNCSLIKKKIAMKTNQHFNSISIKDIFNLTDKSSKIFFKIDIEGSEYRILDDLINFSKNMSGLTIEFHDVDLNINRILDFVKKFDLTLVHIHPNNYSNLGIDNIPTTLELSFSKNPVIIKKTLCFPHKLDQKNDKFSKNINLIFKK
jgi:hypothetical protein